MLEVRTRNLLGLDVPFKQLIVADPALKGGNDRPIVYGEHISSVLGGAGTSVGEFLSDLGGGESSVEVNVNGDAQQWERSFSIRVQTGG